MHVAWHVLKRLEPNKVESFQYFKLFFNILFFPFVWNDIVHVLYLDIFAASFLEYLDYIVVDKLYKLKHKDHGLKKLNSNYLKLRLTEVTFEGSISFPSCIILYIIDHRCSQAHSLSEWNGY